jgi:hypothetical protein
MIDEHYNEQVPIFYSIEIKDEQAFLNESVTRESAIKYFETVFTDRIETSRIDLKNPPSRLKDRWMKLDLSQNTPRISSAPKRIVKKLKRYSNLEFVVSVEKTKEMRSLLGLDKVKKYTKVMIADVGAANWNIISLSKEDLCDICTHYECSYVHFDFGYPLNFHRNSLCQEAQNLPLPSGRFLDHLKGPVILSHWDLDHMLLIEKISWASDVKWLAPKMTAGPKHLNLISPILKNNNLRLYESKKSRHKIGPLEFIRGEGKDKNDSGINLIVHGGNKEKTLLVSDCHYKYISQIKGEKFDFITVSHHGSKKSITKNTIPSPKSRHSIAGVSGSLPNEYSHPSLQSISAHENAGWIIKSVGDYDGNKKTRSQARGLGVLLSYQKPKKCHGSAREKLHTVIGKLNACPWPFNTK